MAQALSSVVLVIILGALGTTFIPVLSGYLQKEDSPKTKKFLNVVYSVTISVTIVVFLLGVIASPLLVKLIAPSFKGELFNLTVKLTQMLFPLTVFTALVSLNNGLLQSKANFIIPAFVGLPQNITMIVFLLYFVSIGDIYGLAATTVIGGVTQVLIQIPSIKKLGYKFKFEFDRKEEGLREIGVLLVPIVIGNGIQQINTLVDKSLASGLAEGSISALNFSNRLNLFILGIFIMAISTVCYPSMAAYYSSGENEKFRRLILNALNSVTLIIIPSTIGFIILRYQILKVLFERGAFDSRATEMTAVALLFYSIGLIGFGFRDVLSKAFYSIKDTRTPMINGTIAVVLNIILNIVLVRYMDIGGLALATSISAIASTLLLIGALYKKIGDFGISTMIVNLLKTLIVSFIMGMIVFYTNIVLVNASVSLYLALPISITIGTIVYLVMISVVGIEEVNQLRSVVIDRIRRIL